MPNCHCPSFVTNIPFFLFLGDEGGLSQQVTRWFLSFPSLLSGRNKTKKHPKQRRGGQGRSLGERNLVLRRLLGGLVLGWSGNNEEVKTWLIFFFDSLIIY